MSRNVLILVTAALAISPLHSVYLQARSTNKTFLATRPVLLNRADDIAMRAHLHKAPTNTAHPARFNAQLFYTESTNYCDLGRYFFFTGRDNFTTFVQTGDPVPERDTSKFIYDNTQSLYTATNTVYCAPKHNEYGIKFSYLQDLAVLKPGLYGRILVPVTTVENNLNFFVAGANATDLTHYFNGSLPSIAVGNANARTPLNNALINGVRRKTGVADVDFLLGYTIKHDASQRFGFHLATSLPTGNVPDGKYLFEPVVGNGGHITSGIGLDYQALFASNSDTSFSYSVQCDYRYGFAATEKRTLGLNNIKMGHYVLCTNQPVGAPLNTIVTIPAANFLTQNVVVTPGNMLDLLLEIQCTYKTMATWLGYNCMYKSRGMVKLNSQWNNTLYGDLTTFTLDLSNSSTTLGSGDILPITEQLLNPHAASAHALTNSLYGGISYETIGSKHPVAISISGHREWAGMNSALATRGITCSIGMAF